MAALFVLLLVVCLKDYQQAKIPNYCVLLIFAVGTVYRFWDSGGGGLLEYFSVCLFTAFILYPFFKIGVIGAGDVKLFAATAGYLSGKTILLFFFTSLLIAAIFSIVKILHEHNGRERLYYLCSYLMQSIQTGHWEFYFRKETDAKGAGICLSGPVFLSILLHIGGVY